jgi:hypothetical protein
MTPELRYYTVDRINLSSDFGLLKKRVAFRSVPNIHNHLFCSSLRCNGWRMQDKLAARKGDWWPIVFGMTKAAPLRVRGAGNPSRVSVAIVPRFLLV